MKGFVRALQNLTRIYIMDMEYSEETFGRATMYFPLVGLVIGLVLLALYYPGNSFFPSLVLAAVLLTAEALLTGGMHLDGFIDSMDGLFSGRPREGKLEIMKDSRIGANGAVGLACLFIMKFALLAELIKFSYPGWLLLTPVISRWCMVYAIRFFPYARPQGMGKAYHEHTGNREFIWATLFTLVIGIIVLKMMIILILAVSLIFTHILARSMALSLGGLTGDTYGAITEIMEIILLILFYLAYRV